MWRIATAIGNCVGCSRGTAERPSGQPAAPHQIKAKILACHGALDPHVPTAHVTAFVDEMNGAEADWQLIVYGDALHGFAHEGSENLGIPGVGYHADADRRSWNAMQSFFAELFGANR
jgi:dienelactone hydrolase